MNEDLVLPDSEKPRFLLPEGCKDLIDAIRLQELNAALAAEMEKQSAPPPAHGFPVCVTIPDSVRVEDLAGMLLLKPFDLIEALIEFHIFVSATSEISFDTAAKVCAHFGVAVHKAEDG